MKSTEEAAREYENKEKENMQIIEETARDYGYISSIIFPEEAVKKAFKAGVEFAQQWISSEDESPKKGDRVLLKDKNGEIECLLIYNEDYVTVLMERFIHWRYLEIK